jgi:hypothetical protein
MPGAVSVALQPSGEDPPRCSPHHAAEEKEVIAVMPHLDRPRMQGDCCCDLHRADQRQSNTGADYSRFTDRNDSGVMLFHRGAALVSRTACLAHHRRCQRDVPHNSAILILTWMTYKAAADPRRDVGNDRPGRYPPAGRAARLSQPHHRCCDPQRRIHKPRMASGRELEKVHAAASASKLLLRLVVRQHG